MQQQEFLVGQYNLHALARHFAAQHVELEVGELEQLRLAHHAAPQQRADAQHQLDERERLDQVIVGTELKPVDAVVDVIARGQEDHRQVAPRAQRAHDFPAVDAGQHHIEHDEVVGMLQRHVQAVRAGTREIHGVAAFAQPLLEVIAGLGVVFDDEDAHDAQCHSTVCCHSSGARSRGL